MTPRPACPLPAQRSLPPAPPTRTLSSPRGPSPRPPASHVSWLRPAWRGQRAGHSLTSPRASRLTTFLSRRHRGHRLPSNFSRLLCHRFLFQTGALAQSSGPFSQRGPSRTVRRPRMDTPTISSPKLPRPSDFLRPQSPCYLHMGYQASQSQHVPPVPGPQPAHSPPQAPGNLYSTS